MLRVTLFLALVTPVLACSESSTFEPDAGPTGDAALYTCSCGPWESDGGVVRTRCESSGSRVPEADHLCAGQPDGHKTPGAPDPTCSGACPNTCSCECFDEKCYASTCTAALTEVCPVFR
jgi:hypothetical protein